MKRRTTKRLTPPAAVPRPARRSPWLVLALAGFAACSSSPPSRDPGPGSEPALDDHHIPGSQIQVPPPVAWTPGPITEPGNPIAHRPPAENPGGVNGDRPVRQAPGLGHAAAAVSLETDDVMPDPSSAAADMRLDPSVTARMQRDFHRIRR